MADYRTPCSGNFIASVLELAERVRNSGGNVYFLFPQSRSGNGYSWSKWLESSDFIVHFFDDKCSDIEKLQLLQSLIEKYSIDIIHTHFSCLHRILIRHRNAFPKVKILIHDHMDYSPEGNLRKQQLCSAIWSAIYNTLGIHVISVMEQKSKGYHFLRKSHNWYVPNGLSMKRNIPHPKSVQETRQCWSIDTNNKTCLFLGWDMYRKGIDIAIKAVSQCRNHDDRWHLGIIGFGDNPSENQLNWIYEHTGVDPKSDWIHYLPSEEDMFACHRASDVYLSASRKEAFSYGLLEAISQDTPVVVSDIEGTKWSWDYNKCFTYPVEDSAACAEALQKAVQSGRKESNSIAITEAYSIQKWCGRIMHIYETMLHKK